jgi:hypothetical protein
MTPSLRGSVFCIRRAGGSAGALHGRAVSSWGWHGGGVTGPGACDARQVLARLPWLRSLNLVANPLAAAPGYLAALHRLAPGLQVRGARSVSPLVHAVMPWGVTIACVIVGATPLSCCSPCAAVQVVG